METGKVRFVYRHYFVISEASVVAAMGTECAAEQGMFWEFHDAIFDNWSEANRNRFAYSWLQETANELGMDTTNFDECMQSGRAFERVRASHQQHAFRIRQWQSRWRRIRGVPPSHRIRPEWELAGLHSAY